MLNKYTLDNGVRVVCENIQYVRSVSIGIWIATGSRRETKKNNGISHFIEHMLFKGTDNRDAKKIAEDIDSIGGQINAFTGKECTCYYTKTLDSNIEIAFDVLADMFFNSRFDVKDIEIEKQVILEEINMYEDSPEELVHDILSEYVWSDSSLGLPILGTKDCLKNLDRNMIIDYKYSNYIPNNIVISAVGNFKNDELLEMVKKYFGKWKSTKNKIEQYGKVNYNTGKIIKEKDTEQIHLCLGFEGVEHGNNDLYSLLAVNNIFGGSMSSRLFQKIREEKGLVYSIYSYPSSYKEAGLFTIYAGMNPKHIDSVIQMIMDEIMILKKTRINEEELKKSKEQLKGNYILGLESTSSRMHSIGKSEVILNRIYTPEKIIEYIDDINMDKINMIIEKIFDVEKLCLTAVGNIESNYEIKKKK